MGVEPNFKAGAAGTENGGGVGSLSFGAICHPSMSLPPGARSLADIKAVIAGAVRRATRRLGREAGDAVTAAGGVVLHLCRPWQAGLRPQSGPEVPR